MVKVLFVCLGNICRSPTAEGVFRSLVAKAGLSDSIVIDSAGTSNWHIGEQPDRRGQDAAALRGYDLSAQRGRQVAGGDFDRFDYIIGMQHAGHRQGAVLAQIFQHKAFTRQAITWATACAAQLGDKPRTIAHFNAADITDATTAQCTEAQRTGAGGGNDQGFGFWVHA